MILVTGAGGHLGANLLRRLCENGQPIRAAFLNAREFPAVEGLDVEPSMGDLSDPKIAAAAVKGCGQPIRAAFLNAREFPAVEGLDVEPLMGDLSDPKIAAAAVKGCNHIYHCAGRVSINHRNSTEIFRANLIVTRELLRAALKQGVEKVVVTSSFSTVGISADGPSNEDHP